MNPSTCKDRIDVSRDIVELYEKSTEQMSNIRCGFLEVFDVMRKKYGHNIHVIDANGDMDDIAKEILNNV